MLALAVLLLLHVLALANVSGSIRVVCFCMCWLQQMLALVFVLFLHGLALANVSVSSVLVCLHVLALANVSGSMCCRVFACVRFSKY